jgi:hypothetical protein
LFEKNAVKSTEILKTKNLLQLFPSQQSQKEKTTTSMQNSILYSIVFLIALFFSTTSFSENKYVSPTIQTTPIILPEVVILGDELPQKDYVLPAEIIWGEREHIPSNGSGIIILEEVIILFDSENTAWKCNTIVLPPVNVIGAPQASENILK